MLLASAFTNAPNPLKTALGSIKYADFFIKSLNKFPDFLVPKSDIENPKLLFLLSLFALDLSLPSHFILCCYTESNYWDHKYKVGTFKGSGKKFLWLHILNSYDLNTVRGHS